MQKLNGATQSKKYLLMNRKAEEMDLGAVVGHKKAKMTGQAPSLSHIISCLFNGGKSNA